MKQRLYKPTIINPLEKENQASRPWAKLKFCALLCFSLYFFSACEIINPPEEIPAFLRIENFELTTSGFEGSNTHKITDAWVYVNGELLGAFPLPATVPVLWNGDAELIIDPGIKDNGIEASPEIYPYYQRFTQQITLNPTETLTIQPTTRYKTNLRFPLIETFDESLHTLREDFDDDPNTFVEISMDDVFEGRGTGQIKLTSDNPEILVATSVKFKELPTDGFSQVYLELDYKTDVPFEIGFRGSNDGETGAFGFNNGINIKTEWNKVYLNLTETLIVSQLAQYQLAIRAIFPSEGFDKTEAIILFDNIKLVHREE